MDEMITHLKRSEGDTRRGTWHLFFDGTASAPRVLLLLQVPLEGLTDSHFSFFVNLSHSYSTSASLANSSTWVPKVFLVSVILYLQKQWQINCNSKGRQRRYYSGFTAGFPLCSLNTAVQNYVGKVESILLFSELSHRITFLHLSYSFTASFLARRIYRLRQRLHELHWRRFLSIRWKSDC